MNTTIDYPDVNAGEEVALAARQLNAAHRGATNFRCSVIQSGREVGQIPDDECCPQRAVFLVDFHDYRSGFSSGGVFTPAQHINARVCAMHEPVFAAAPGFIRSQPWTPAEVPA